MRERGGGRKREEERVRERGREGERMDNRQCVTKIFAEGVSVCVPVCWHIHVFGTRTCALGNHVFPQIRILVGEAEVQARVAVTVLVVHGALVPVSGSDVWV